MGKSLLFLLVLLLSSISLADYADCSSASATRSWVCQHSLDGVLHAVGDEYGGGTVFYIYDMVGAKGLHGLMVAKQELPAVQWDSSTRTNCGTKSDGIGIGRINTRIIIANIPTANCVAAFNSATYTYTDETSGVAYGGDWYLPAMQELIKLYEAFPEKFTSSCYWSSTEDGVNNAKILLPGLNGKYIDGSAVKTASCGLYPIKAF